MNEPTTIFLTAAELLEEVSDALLHVRNSLQAHPSDNWPPTLHVLHRDGEVEKGDIFVLNVPFNEDAEKREILSLLGMQCAKKKMLVRAVLLTCEAWMAPEGRSRGVEPRHNPQRKEVVICFGSTPMNTQSAIAMCHVTRDADNHIVTGDPLPPQLASRESLLRHFWHGYSIHLS